MRINLLIFFLCTCVTGVSLAAKNLDALLQDVKQAKRWASKQNAEREATFKQQLGNRKALLQQAQSDLKKTLQRSQTLKETLTGNEQRLREIDQEIHEKGASLGELFGVVRQIAGEAHAAFKQSIVSAEFTGREPFLKAMADSKSLPSMDDLNQLWYEMQRQMTESGKVSRFATTVITADGHEETQHVTRIGEYNLITAAGAYLNYLPNTQQLVELGRQPPQPFQTMADRLHQAQQGDHPFALDPSRGALLNMLTQVPNMEERVRQGGIIGYVILGIGALALLVSVERYLYLAFVGFTVNRQKRRELASKRNPLGRVFQVYQNDREQDIETLSLKLNEAILRETPRLERRMVMLGVFATICPLLGLLGTVTGMIETFQSIAIFGTGDPKLMSGGISQALVTTGLGLIVAVPIILSHAFLQSKSNRLIQVLDEESAGLVAQFSEQRHAVR